MPKKKPESKAAATATATEIEHAIQALNRMAERLWGDGREIEAKALLDALDSKQGAGPDQDWRKPQGCDSSLKTVMQISGGGSDRRTMSHRSSCSDAFSSVVRLALFHHRAPFLNA